MLIMAIPANGL